jgi:predicted transposase YbfD/YdcC
VTAKSNEIPAVRDLLKAFTSLAGAVVTIDALHTQHDTAGSLADVQHDLKNMGAHSELRSDPQPAISAALLLPAGIDAALDALRPH